MDVNAMKAAAMKQAEEAKQAVLHLETITHEPMKAQRELLCRLLEDNKNTEYGKKYGFADIHTVEEYRKAVPVTTYDDYAAYIRRMSEGRERNLITSYEMALYNKTSGTVGAPKCIPMTKNSLENFMTNNKSYEIGKLGQWFGDAMSRGRTILLTQSNPDFSVMPDGLPFGAVSDTVTLKAKPFWTKLYTSPVAASFAGPGTDPLYLHALYSLIDPLPVKINCSYVSFILEFFRYIEHNWEMLVNDIENGTIDSSVRLPDKVRDELMKERVPAPERAKELRRVFENGFDRPFVPEVWPQIKAICGGASGTFKAYTQKIRDRYTGNIPFYCRGVGASEGVFTVAFEPDSCESVLVPDAVFFEFLPEGAEDFASLITLDRLETGKKYELFITNLSGLYRYRMKDVFLVTGHHNNTPAVEFQYRSEKNVNIMGERTSEAAILLAADMTAKQCGFELIESTVYPDIENLRYRFIFETDIMPSGSSAEKIRGILEENLANVNPYLGDLIKKGICAPTDLLFARRGTFAMYREKLLREGYSVGQIKPVTVITNELQRQYFFSSVEKINTNNDL